jgi:pectate lyase
MKKMIYTFCILQFAFCTLHSLPSFPGAEGWGTETPGGRGGRVILVTNTGPSGAGSLTTALKASGPRIIVFTVSGVIDLPNISLVLSNSDVTIAGQTSPGGVTLTNTFSGQNILTSYHQDFNNAVFRFLRLRALSNNTDDCASFNTCNHLVFDHCEFSGGQDECFSLPANNDVTIQWCSIHNSTPNTGGSGWGGTLMGYLPTSHISIHHNLWAHNFARYPGLHWGDQQPPDSGKIDMRNNIVYNTQRTYGITGSFTGTLWVNSVGNLFIEGPSSEAIQNQLTLGGIIYARDNYNYLLTSEKVDLCSGAGLFRSYGDMRYGDTVSTPWPCPEVTTFSSEAAYDSVLNKVGALPRDTMMRRTVEEIHARTGEVKTVGYDLLAYAPLPSGPGPAAPADADMDGMPDFWETGMGFNPSDSAGKNADHDNDGYTNIEEYINDLALARLCEDYYNQVYPVPDNWDDYDPSCCRSLAVESPQTMTSIYPDRLTVSPNPGYGTAFHVKTSLNHGNIRIFDMTGRLVADFPTGKAARWNPGNNIAAGVYTVSWTLGKTVKGQKRLVLIK